MKNTFIIDRSKWVSASCGIGEELMQNEEGFMCCLGHVARQIQPRIRMKGKPTPVWLDFKEENFLIEPDNFTSFFAHKAMVINGICEIGNEEREARLTAHFEAAGMGLKFKGKAVPRKR